MPAPPVTAALVPTVTTLFVVPLAADRTAVEPERSTEVSVAIADRSTVTPPEPVTTALVSAGAVTVREFDFVPPMFSVVATAPLIDVVAAAVVLTVNDVALAAVTRPAVCAPETFITTAVACASVTVPLFTVPDSFRVRVRAPAAAVTVTAPAELFRLTVLIALPVNVTAPVLPCTVTVCRLLPVRAAVVLVSVMSTVVQPVPDVLTKETELALFSVALAAAAVVRAPAEVTFRALTPVPNVVSVTATPFEAAAAPVRARLTVVRPETLDEAGIVEAWNAP